MPVYKDKKCIPSLSVLLTVAQVTRSEEGRTARMAAAKRWLGVSNYCGNREYIILENFWQLLDDEPVDHIPDHTVARHKTYT